MSIFQSEMIVKLLKYTETEKELIIIMEYINSASWLENKIELRKREIKNTEKLKRYARDILRALQLMHAKNIIHADIKVQNILVQKPTPDQKANGQVSKIKLCDFGISQKMRAELIDGKNRGIMKERSGTAAYMAPEVKGKNILVGPEIDLWAFGILLYELAVAYKPT